MSPNPLAIAQADFDLPSLFRLAAALMQARGFIPAHLRTEGELVAVILAGRELGLPPMAALRSISLIQGKVILDASMQLALMVRAGAKVRWLRDGTDGEEAVLEVSRDGHAPHHSRYTIHMAERAGLTKNATWQKHTAAMLRARAVSAAGKAYMPDVLSGCYVPGEIEDESPVRPVEPASRHVEAPRSPETAPALPANVVELPRAPEATEEPRNAVSGEDPAVKTALDLFLPKLRARKTAPELEAWIGEVLKANYPEPVQRALRRAFGAHARSKGHDANQLVAAAKAKLAAKPVGGDK